MRSKLARLCGGCFGSGFLLACEFRRLLRFLLLGERRSSGCLGFGLRACGLLLLELRFELWFLGIRRLLLGESLARFRCLALGLLPLFIEPLQSDRARVLGGLHRFARGHLNILARHLTLLRIFRLLQQLLSLLKAGTGVFVRARCLRDLHGVARFVETQRHAWIEGSAVTIMAKA